MDDLLRKAFIAGFRTALQYTDAKFSHEFICEESNNEADKWLRKFNKCLDELIDI